MNYLKNGWHSGRFATFFSGLWHNCHTHGDVAALQECNLHMLKRAMDGGGVSTRAKHLTGPTGPNSNRPPSGNGPTGPQWANGPATGPRYLSFLMVFVCACVWRAQETSTGAQQLLARRHLSCTNLKLSITLLCGVPILFKSLK